MTNIDPNKSYFFSWIICLLFVLTYGTFLYITSDILELRYVQWSVITLLYSIPLFVALLIFYKPIKGGWFVSYAMPRRTISYPVIFFLFVISAIIFTHYPWHDDRTSTGASFAAIMRAIWLFVSFSVIQDILQKRNIVLILTVILMYIDESRTYFFIALLAIVSSYRNRLSIFSILILLVIILAAIRSENYYNFFQAIYFGLFGEIYNATRVVDQVSRLTDIHYFEPGHVVGLFTQPLSFLLHKLELFGFDKAIFSLGDDVAFQLDEKIAPLGGWYIIADFVHLGLLGHFLLFIYAILMVYITRFLFYDGRFHYYIFLIPIFIKSSPFIYMNFIIYVWLVFFVMRNIMRLRLL